MEKTPGQRIKEERNALHWSQQKLADEISRAKKKKISRAAIALWENGESKTQKAVNLFAAAKAMGLVPEWVLTGIGQKRDKDADDNVREGPEIRGLVPLISSVQAGNWAEIVDNFQPGDAEMWLPCPVKHGPHTFCLVVDGESMRHPGSKPNYDPGDIIFVDPDVQAKPGDRVVVRLDGQKKATFKQYMEEDGIKRLKALNPDWRPKYIEISEEAVICGVVIGKWVPE
jgi:SOS-response transcriptional repressor LexA